MQPSSPTHVLHVLNSASGGAALSTLGIIDYLEKQGIQSSAVCHTGGTEADKQRLIDALNGRVIFTTLYWTNRKLRAPLWKRPFIEARQLVTTGATLKSGRTVADFAHLHKIDLIHTNTILTPEGAYAAQALKLPHAWHLRELLGPGNPFRLPFEGARFGTYLKKRCSALIANAHRTAEIVRPWMPTGLLRVVPNGIDLTDFLRIPRAVASNKKVVIGMVGSLTSRWKKHALFIEAAALVDRNLPVEFRIYGEDPSHNGTVPGDAYVDALRSSITHYQLADRISFRGHVSNPAAIMSELDILCHPADGESFGRIVAEAMAAGLPVVGVRGGGVGELVDDEITGLLADIDNAQELARHLETLIGNPQTRHNLGIAGRKRAVEHYSIDACGTAILAVYRDIMARPLP